MVRKCKIDMLNIVRTLVFFVSYLTMFMLLDNIALALLVFIVLEIATGIVMVLSDHPYIDISDALLVAGMETMILIISSLTIAFLWRLW